MEAKKEKTVFGHAVDLANKEHAPSDSIEMQQAMQENLLEDIKWAVRHKLKEVPCPTDDKSKQWHISCATESKWNHDFYVVVHTKRERLSPNIFRNIIFTTRACPTPTYDQQVYKYNHKHEEIYFLWVVPDQETCVLFRANPTQIHPEERQLYEFIMDFYEGRLDWKCRSENGELLSPVLN